jgi:hypothetical protein
MKVAKYALGNCIGELLVGLVKFLFYPRFSTVNRVFEGTFLPHHLRQCPASLPL